MFCLTLAVGCGEAAKPEGDGAEKAEPAAGTATKPEKPVLTQEQLEALYRSSKARVEAEALSQEVFEQVVVDLRRVAEEAEDAHLRANASLLLGALHDERGDRRSALSFYRQAKELVPDDASTHAVLAMTLAEDKQWDEALAEQWLVVELVPDDLTGWLLLGEMHIKAGKIEEAPMVYGAYELRRHGLLEGLTAKHEGAYVKDEAHRADCVEALAPAVDNGTASALMYALETDPAPVVRERLALVMGDQRLIGYLEHLKKRLAVETDTKVQEAMKWAIEEIEGDPVETAPGAVPEEIREQVEAEEKVLAAKAAAEAEAAAGQGDAGSGEGDAAKIPASAGEDAKAPAPADEDAKAPAPAGEDAKPG